MRMPPHSCADRQSHQVGRMRRKGGLGEEEKKSIKPGLRISGRSGVQHRAATWTAYMLEKKEPATITCENDPVAELTQLGDRLNLSGTPTVFFSDGTRNTGGMAAAELKTRLAEISNVSSDTSSCGPAAWPPACAPTTSGTPW